MIYVHPIMLRLAAEQDVKNQRAAFERWWSEQDLQPKRVNDNVRRNTSKNTG